MASVNVELWKDPDARWASGVEDTGHPAGELDLGQFPSDGLGSTFDSTMSLTFSCLRLPD